MVLFDTPTTVNKKQLQQFGCICLFLLPTITWFWNAKPAYVVLSAVLGAVIMGLAWFLPRIVTPLFLVLMFIAAPIGLIMGEIAMTTLYLLVFCPIGLIFRLQKRDALQLSNHSHSQSYWSEKSSPDSSESYYRLF